MKNLRMILVMATMMVSIPANAIMMGNPRENSLFVHFGKNCACKISTNDSSNNGNVLHQVINHDGDEA